MGEFADEAIERGFNDFNDYEKHKDNPEELYDHGFCDADGFIKNPYDGDKV